MMGEIVIIFYVFGQIKLCFQGSLKFKKGFWELKKNIYVDHKANMDWTTLWSLGNTYPCKHQLNNI